MIDVGKTAILLNGFSKNEAEDIRRCLSALYMVRVGEQPLDRDFGLDQSFVDQPLNIAKNLLALEVIKKTKRYEKRVEVEKIDFKFDEEGQMIPVVYVKKRGDLT